MKNTLSYLVFALVATTSSLAFGLAVEDPCALIDCADGEICEILEGPVCACAEPPPGEDPVPCDCGTPDEQAVCVPAPPPECNSDADCNGDDVCVTYSYGECSGSPGIEPCPEGEDCNTAPRREPVCTEETESICVPKYAAPCQAASDCGSGFTCETPEICTCTAGAPIACDSEDPDECLDLPPGGDDDCTCEPSSGDAYCRLIEVECVSDTDCQDGSSCKSIYGEDTQTRPAAIPCEEGDENCGGDPLPPSLYCIPDGYGEWAENGGPTTVDGRKVESAKRTSFFNPNNPGTGSGDGSKDAATCSVSQGPVGFAGSALLLFAMMFGFRRKKN